MKLVTRGIEEELRDVLAVSRAAPSPGPRQSCKSTLAKQQLRDVVPISFSLDEEATRNAALADPDGFARARRAPLRLTQRAGVRPVPHPSTARHEPAPRYLTVLAERQVGDATVEGVLRIT